VAGKEKVWVIKPTESNDEKLHIQEMRQGRFARRRAAVASEAPGASDPWASDSIGAGEAGRPDELGQAGRESYRPDEKGSPLLTLISYLAGPYAILTTRRGRENRFWVVLAIVSSLAAVVIGLRANAIFGGPHGKGVGFMVWLAVACLVTIMVFATWARGIFLLGHHRSWLLRRLPSWIRHPGAAGLLGLVIPGFGLFIAEHPRRAAATLMVVCGMVLSVLVFWQSPVLWRLSHAAGPLTGRGDSLERVFLVMGAIALFGAFVWIVQALDGARLAGYRMESPPRPHGDIVALALIVTIAALLVSFKPARVAETLDRFAVSTRIDGFRIIPLYASRAATILDPSRPEYAIQTVEINEELGRGNAARAMRRDLAERWRPYERMLRLEASLSRDALLPPAPAANPGPASVPAPGAANRHGAASPQRAALAEDAADHMSGTGK
jgi:hypothetical protein